MWSQLKKYFFNGTFKKVVAQTTMFDVAIGLAIAGVFVKLVNAFVIHILTPPLGALIGGKSLAKFQWSLALVPGKEPVVISYGVFLDACIEFLFVAVVVYWVARLVLRVKQRGKEAKHCKECAMSIPQKATTCPYCREKLQK